ncbi:PLP-dependent aminotransferase family protein [Enterovibrio nigricans]|uniref:DNA-binding transcriptional regulator, MocR family, contains an aminotransferase domain n=1 Tax=Enterovibrio nigricans DSM 22720 TaxID=1121868 RepID=A0A1T4U904_9GAMM|nr:PLP-dependent aminotransferase family protein [Enterovibrio nigricans]PKF51522.1 PLP-dependent aminotransferase family protein [Enterovibrio nigricans]SKA49008.1 DNA-binding transcriptional regulator, MocR family, contains an aminotransferase domain [Enterovibrio nigricans DSM 22720]
MTIINITLDKSGAPMYRQIADAIGVKVNSKELAPGEKLPTHRALADALSVTVGTITRAYAEAERRGIVEAKVGAGTYISQTDKPLWTFSAPERPGITSFGYNVPPTLNRADVFSDALQQLASHPNELNSLMLYQPPSGIVRHREILSQWLAQHGVTTSPSQLLFCSGAQNAMQLCLLTLCRAGDTILADKFTYPGLMSLAKQLQLTIKPVEMDDEGMLPDALRAACQQYQPRLVYLTPTLQNPTTATMSEARRIEVIEICREQQLVILEDDINGLLPTERPEPMINLAPDLVIYIGGLAKTLAPGLRLGFLHLPERYYPHFVNALQNHSWMISPLLTAMAAILLENGAANQMLDTIRTEMEKRWQCVAHHLRDSDLRYQPNGFHGWLKLPDDWALSDFLAACKENGLEVKSAELFIPPGYGAPPYIRIAVSAPPTRDILEQGCKKLAQLLANPPISEFAL